MEGVHSRTDFDLKQHAQFSGKNLLALINDILDFNKIEAGKLELEEIDFNLNELLESIRASLDTLASKKGIEFQLKYDENLPKYFKGDSVRLNQVITNLSNNAIKFTDEGYVALKVRLLNQGEDSCRIKFEVKDTGIGIPQTKIEKIFRSFEQASSDTHRKYGGSGLGLSITKKILEVMGTTIHVNSSEGLGSVFSFELELPIGINTDEVPELAAGEDQFDPDLKLLVAEDNPGNRTLIESLFKRWNLSWDFAFDGKVAVEKIKSKKYHIVLMDLQMPELDGYGATREIRKMDGEYFKNIPVIALTASVMSNVLEKTKKAGMNNYISKPFDPKNLKNTVIKYTRFFKQTYGEYINTDIDENEISQPDAGNKEFDIILKDLPVQEEKNNSKSDKFDFPYIKELVGDDEEAISEIVVSSLESVINAKNGINEGISSNDITRVRSELHILRPNLHNIELGFLVDDLPKITELSDETKEILKNLLSGIEKEIETEKFKPFTK